MNTILTFLEENRQRLDLARYGADGTLSNLILTPRFRASSHVVFLILTAGKADPVLVAKAPRLVNTTDSLEREVSNLRQVQSLKSEGFDSIPRVVTFEAYKEHPILVETALVGRPMDPPFVRSQRERCCGAVLDWLMAVQQPPSDAEKGPENEGEDAYHRLVEAPLRYFAQRIPLSEKEAWLLTRTRELCEPLRELFAPRHAQSLPLVFEHGDLSYPNLMLLPTGEPGVVDWELAEPRGLPASDLFFFLTYVAFAEHRARENSRYLSAFQAAFFEDANWAKRYTQMYASHLGLPATALTPLFIITWLRYVVGLLTRLAQTGTGAEKFDAETVRWVRQNRYYQLWQYAVVHSHKLAW